MSELLAAHIAVLPSAAAPSSPTQQQQPLLGLPLSSMDLSSHADSGSSLLSQGSTSGASDQLAGPVAAAAVVPLAASRSGSGEGLEPAPSGGFQEYGEPSQLARSSSGGVPFKKDDAKSSALKALAGVSAIVSKSR